MAGILGLYRYNEKENGNYHILMVYILGFRMTSSLSTWPFREGSCRIFSIDLGL